MTLAFLVAALAVLHQSSAVTIAEFFSMRVKIQNFAIFSLLGFAWHLIFSLSGLYTSRRLSNRRTEVLDVFKERKDEIIADIDANFGTGRRGMYVYQWYGKHKIDNVAEFNKDFKYIKTIAVSVFRGRESTSWHFGPKLQ